jgi:hypothetical protein
VGGQLPGLRCPQALEGRPACRPRRRTRSGGPAHASRRDHRRPARQTSQNHQTRPHRRAPSRPGPTELHRDGTQCAVGDRSDVRADLGWGGLRLLHHRCLQPDDRRLARRWSYAYHDGARCHRDGALVTGKHVARLDHVTPMPVRSSRPSGTANGSPRSGLCPPSAPSGTASTTPSRRR